MLITRNLVGLYSLLATLVVHNRLLINYLLGMWSLANVDPNLEGLSLAIFTRMLGWTPEEVALFLVGVRKELKSPRVHAYWQV